MTKELTQADAAIFDFLRAERDAFLKEKSNGQTTIKGRQAQRATFNADVKVVYLNKKTADVPLFV